MSRFHWKSQQDLNQPLYYPSPNRKHDLYLELAGGIRFGADYFTLIMRSHRFRGRYFGAEVVWDAASRFAAVQEWLCIDEGKSPHTRLVLLDPAQGSQALVDDAPGGFINTLRFYPESLTYQKVFFGVDKDEREIHNVLLDDIRDWTPWT